jgi:hypothetical protein
MGEFRILCDADPVPEKPDPDAHMKRQEVVAFNESQKEI